MTKGSRKTGGRRLRRLREVEAFQRTSRQHSEKTTILIVGEGEKTERNYFRGLKGEKAVWARFTVTVKKGHGSSAEDVVNEAIDHKKGAKHRGQEYDDVWCVLDVEGPDKRESLDSAVTLAKENGIKLCLSNPSFEVWLLAHFEKTATYFPNSDAVIVELNKEWQANFNLDYRKNDKAVYDRLKCLVRAAVQNAKWVREIHHREKDNTADCNSSTEVYRLVERLTA